MTQIYEGMFVLDNDLVRESWAKAKASVGDLITKHGGTVHTSRRWAERRLAYPIKDRLRATYLLNYYEIPAEGIPNLIRDLDLSETLLRYLILKVDDIAPGEKELSDAESAADYVVPAPPDGDAGSYRPLQVEGEGEEEDGAPSSDSGRSERASETPSPASSDAAKPAEADSPAATAVADPEPAAEDTAKTTEE